MKTLNIIMTVIGYTVTLSIMARYILFPCWDWSKVMDNGRKPIGWWVLKIWCEMLYGMANHRSSDKVLGIMIKKYNRNLYGQRTINQVFKSEKHGNKQ